MMNDATALNYMDLVTKLSERFTPHPGQQLCGQQLFDKDLRKLFLQCGRKWGKTDFILYCLYRWAKTYPNSSCYYISPFQKQSKEIIWANKRVQNFPPPEWISSINNTEMRVTLSNGSFIKLDGSDNYTAYDGTEPHIMVFDEFRDFRPEFLERVNPNLSVYNAPLIIIGTPPKVEGQYTTIANEFKADPEAFWYQGKSEDNPYIDKKWLSTEKKNLIGRGEADVWEREYQARFVKGGKSSIFPMLSDSHVIPHKVLISKIARDKKKLRWYCIADPGTTTCFGVLFVAINPYTKEVYFLDEIYETDQKKTSVRLVGSDIIKKKDELNNDAFAWFNGRDLAATWFENEMLDLANLKGFDANDHVFIGVDKKANAKEEHLSIIKDALLEMKLIFSDRCVKLFWEMGNYVLDDKGKIPKKNDHLIDCMRYFVEAEGYELTNTAEPVAEVDDENFRGATIEQDMRDGNFNDSDGIEIPINMEGF